MRQQVVQYVTRINRLLKLTLQKNFLATKSHTNSIWFDFVQLVAHWQMFVEWCHYKLRQPVTLCVLTHTFFFLDYTRDVLWHLLWIFEQLIPSVIPGTSLATMSCIVLSNLKNFRQLFNDKLYNVMLLAQNAFRSRKCFQYKSLFKSLASVSFTSLLDFWLN